MKDFLIKSKKVRDYDSSKMENKKPISASKDYPFLEKHSIEILFSWQVY